MARETNAAPTGPAPLTESQIATLEDINSLIAGDTEATPISVSDWDTVRAIVFNNPAIPNDIILVALRYCAKRRLDVMKKPVAIVKRGKSWVFQPTMVESRTTATRTLAYAGKDACVLGPDVETVYQVADWKGVPSGGTPNRVNKTVKHSEWAQCTVYRMVQGVRCAFTSEQIYWEERAPVDPNYNSLSPSWLAQPRTMLPKCAEAAALRHAFPEEVSGLPTEDEPVFEGMTIEGEAIEEPDGGSKVVAGGGKKNLDKVTAKANGHANGAEAPTSPPPPPPPPAEPAKPYHLTLNTGSGTGIEDLGSDFPAAKPFLTAYWTNIKLLKDAHNGVPSAAERLAAVQAIINDNAAEVARAALAEPEGARNSGIMVSRVVEIIKAAIPEAGK